MSDYNKIRRDLNMMIRIKKVQKLDTKLQAVVIQLLTMTEKGNNRI